MARLKKDSGSGEQTSSSITHKLKDLEAIVAWFTAEKDVDIEEGLEKVRQGARLIKELKVGLSNVENEFKEIQKGLDS